MKKPLKRLLIAALAAILIVLFAMCCIAQFDFSNLDPEVYEFFDSFIRINRDQLDTEPQEYSPKSNEIVKLLTDKGIPNIILPSAVLTDEWEVTRIHFQPTEQNDYPSVTSDINLQNEKGLCIINVWYVDYGDLVFTNPTTDLSNVLRAETLQVNGLTVTVALHLRGSITVTYIDMNEGKTEYVLSFTDFTFEEVLEIAKTIGN